MKALLLVVAVAVTRDFSIQGRLARHTTHSALIDPTLSFLRYLAIPRIDLVALISLTTTATLIRHPITTKPVTGLVKMKMPWVDEWQSSPELQCHELNRLQE